MAWGDFEGTLYRPTMPSDRITKISIHCGVVIDALSFQYTFNGETYTAGPWGGRLGGTKHEIAVGDGDELIGISGTYGSYPGSKDHIVIRSLAFLTKYNKIHEQYGTPAYSPGIPFSFRGDSILSFCVWTRGRYVNGISVHTAYDFDRLDEPNDELHHELHRKFERVTAPDSITFALRKYEDMKYSEAATLRGATALSGVSLGVHFIDDELQKFHHVLTNTNANWEDACDNVRKCVKDLENVSNTTEKAIHTFLNEVARIIPFPLRACSPRINTRPVNIYALYKLSKKIKEIKQTVENIKVKDRDLGEVSLLPARMSHLGIDEAKLLDLQVHWNKLINNWLDQGPQIQGPQIHLVRGIVKGSAKTVLVEKIYQSAKVKNRFDECFWLIPHIYLFKPVDILRKMLLKLEFTDSLDLHSEVDLISKLDDCLKGKSCLVVIDEYWTKLWTILTNAAFSKGDSGNRVFLIITEESVRRITTPSIHELPSIDASESLKLVRRLGERNSLEFEDDGNPLFDPFFCHKTLLSWAGENQLFPIISRIFSQLPSSLKTCFAYTAAVFPYGSVIHSTSIRQLWIVEGIIPHDSTAESCLQQLVQRGLIRVITTYYHNQANQPVHSVIIHLNLHHKFNIAAREKAKSGNNSTTWEKEILPVEAILVKDEYDIRNYLESSFNDPTSTRCHRLAFHLPYHSEFTSFYPFVKGHMDQDWNCPNLHSLFFFGSVAPIEFHPFNYLRVLAVFWANVRFPEEDTPCTLEGLINLRYLGFIVCKVEGGSLGKALGRLTKLRILDLSDSIVSGLSNFIENNTKVTVVGPVSEELQKFWSPIPDMAQEVEVEVAQTK